MPKPDFTSRAHDQVASLEKMEEFSDWMKLYMIMGLKENDAAWKAGSFEALTFPLRLMSLSKHLVS